MAARLMHARSLELVFRSVLALVGAAATCVVVTTSCSGDKTDNAPGGSCELAGDAPVYSCSQIAVPLKEGATAAACGLPAFGSSSDPDICERFCFSANRGVVTCSFLAGKNAVSCGFGCVVDGRRPPHLCDAPSDRSTLGAWFATMAFHEAASVDAFEILGDELRAHGAPKSMLRSIARARADEVRHARRAGALSRRHGSTPRKPRVPRNKRRDLFTIALENAREGCARETFGALIGFYQASHAETTELREFYRSIARDELRHAALSWRMHAWMIERLSESQRAEVERALGESLAAAHIEASPALGATLGLPTATELHALRLSLMRYAADARMRRSAASASF